MSPRRVALALFAVSALGLVLRLVGLSSDLWLDELATLELLRGQSAWELLFGWPTPNQHPLNSLLVSQLIALWGDSERVVRLPAVLFGAASVPAMYWLARRCAFEPPLALAAALLLAVSEHHLLISQSARGYTGYLFFSLVGTAALAELLERPARGLAFLYPVVMGLAFVSLVQSAFLYAVHLGLFFWHWRRAASFESRALVVPLCGAGALGAVLFIPVAQRIGSQLQANYGREVATAYAPLSARLWDEVWAGLSAGLAGGLWFAAVPLVAAGALGLLVLFRKSPFVPSALLGSQLLFFAVAVALGWQVYPRFFVLALPLGILAVLAAFEGAGRLMRRPEVTVGLVALAALASLAALPAYFRTPRQPYRAAIAFAERQSAGGLVVGVGLTDRGLHYYAPRLGLEPARAPTTRTLEGLEKLLAERGESTVVALTTFQRALESETPELAAALESGFRRGPVFLARVHGGEISLWIREPRRGP